MASYGAYQVGMVGNAADDAWTIIGSASLSIGAASASFTGNDDVGAALSYMALFNAAMGLIDHVAAGEYESPANSGPNLDVPGVGNYGGMSQDLPMAMWDRFAHLVVSGEWSCETLSSRMAERSSADYQNGQSSSIAAHSWGVIKAIRSFFTLIKSGQANPLGSKITIAGSPISRMEAAAIFGSGNVLSINNALDPIPNIASTPWNPVRTAFGIMTLGPLLSYHDANLHYGFNFK